MFDPCVHFCQPLDIPADPPRGYLEPYNPPIGLGQDPSKFAASSPAGIYDLEELHDLNTGNNVLISIGGAKISGRGLKSSMIAPLAFSGHPKLSSPAPSPCISCK
jgi:hypothetical protein